MHVANAVFPFAETFRILYERNLHSFYLPIDLLMYSELLSGIWTCMSSEHFTNLLLVCFDLILIGSRQKNGHWFSFMISSPCAWSILGFITGSPTFNPT